MVCPDHPDQGQSMCSFTCTFPTVSVTTVGATVAGKGLQVAGAMARAGTQRGV